MGENEYKRTKRSMQSMNSGPNEFPFKIMQVTPHMPPDKGGVSDYVGHLHRLFQRRGCTVATVKLLPGCQLIDYDSGYKLSPADTHALRAGEAGGRTVILHHFSGYGYADHGNCQWVACDISKLAQSVEASKIVNIFHEVHVDRTWPWRRAFWYRGRQMQIASSLSALAQKNFVTSPRGKRQLMALEGSGEVEVLAVPSTVGEPSAMKSPEERAPAAVLFGGGAKAMAVKALVEGNASAIATRLKRLGVEEIWDVGQSSGLVRLGGIPVIDLGYLSAPEVQATLGRSRIGLFSYSVDEFDKSSVLAAYLAHGVIPINVSSVGVSGASDPWSVDRLGPGSDLAVAQGRTREFYARRCWASVTSRLLEDLI